MDLKQFHINQSIWPVKFVNIYINRVCDNHHDEDFWGGGCGIFGALFFQTIILSKFQYLLVFFWCFVVVNIQVFYNRRVP